MKNFQLSENGLTIEQAMQAVVSGGEISLSDKIWKKIESSYQFLTDYIKKSTKPIYGVNTGFGSLCDVVINDNELEELQYNLVRSHACGMGNKLEPEIAKLMLLLKVHGLAQGHSGVHKETVERLVFFFNNNIIPVVYEQGSLGASGDLAPLAHLSLPLIGLGEVYYEGKIQQAADVLKKHNLSPLKLKAKEGLALLNGTQFMSALGCWNTWHAWNLFNYSNKIAAVSIDAFDCRKEPFIDSLHKIRPHEGQKITASAIRKLLEGSAIHAQEKTAVQDPYSFRCIPQVHGATYDAIMFVQKTVETEINSVTDNPTVFPEENLVVSGGNFHGQPLAIAMDLLAIAVAELGSISERRTYKLISGQRGLPPFLAKNPGKHSGFMIPQYTAASIVSRNKQLCTPSVVDTIDSSNGQEDHVSMGANSAVKCKEVVINVEKVLAIELMNAAQALEFRRPLKSSAEIEKWISAYRKVVPFLEEDTYLGELMLKTVKFIFD